MDREPNLFDFLMSIIIIAGLSILFPIILIIISLMFPKLFWGMLERGIDKIVFNNKDE